jgi:hypothetical protein
MIIDTRGGLALYVHQFRFSRLRRQWEWSIYTTGPLGQRLRLADGQTWTHRSAIAHGNICRTLMLAAGSPVATRYPQDDLEGWR